MRKELKKRVKEESKSPFETLAKHVSNSAQAKGSIYEEDLITQVIRAAIELVRQNTKKECVLVIDDLDRLDPEHIFRILNILSSHSNHFDSDKFGFSKVILVCDIDNIEHLFRYRYGPNADFSGYIEKYFTYEPFRFSIVDSIISFCSESTAIQDLDENNRAVLALLLIDFFEGGVLNIRNLKKMLQVDFKKEFKKVVYEFDVEKLKQQRWSSAFFHGKLFQVDFNNYSFLKVLYVLSIAFGGISNLHSAVNERNKISHKRIEQKYIEPIIRSLAIISHISKMAHANDYTVFFSVREYNDRTHVDFGHPKFSFSLFEGNLPLKWDERNMYTSGHYFVLQHEEVLINMRKRKGKLLVMSNIYSEIIKVINFVTRERIFENN